jgi:hypothetical protein
MSLTPGTRLGSYIIEVPLGAGGMGEVYRATDTRLNRQVAIKVLPEAFATDPDRLARFRREAQVLASLNHPNIGHIYGFEDVPSTSLGQPTHSLVLELVEGPTLADRIAQAPLAIVEALSIARQIIEALEAAHEQGIVHRDLKPANIKVREDGTVKVLDFGLAKALEPSSAPGVDALNSPTLTARATQLGVILGTAAYMAPEQAKGKAVDKRADIWAFGVVLCEMLTGDRLFSGDSLSETLASVIKDDPRLDRLPPGTPSGVRRLIARCLERDPRFRLRDIGEARILLTQPLEDPATPSRIPATRGRSWLFAAGAVVLAIVVGAAAWFLKPSERVPLRRFELPAAIAAAKEAALSPDGTSIAYVANGHLYVRALDALEARDLGAGHVTSNTLFWSPDSRTIGFSAEATIRTIPSVGGPTFVVGKVPASGQIMGASWLTSGNIVFSVWRDSLYTVPATGGTPVVRLAIDPATEVDFHTVAALPDDRLIVDTHQRKDDTDLAQLVDGARRVAISSERDARSFEYVPPGFLLFQRLTTNAGLWVVPFKDGPVDLTQATLIQAGAAEFSAARDGTVIFVLRAPSRSSLVWADRAGATSPVPGSSAEVSRYELALSPDGRRAAFIVGSGPNANVIVRDLASGVDTPLTFNKPADDGGAWFDTRSPAWFPSGDRILHMTGSVEAVKLVARRADIAGEARELTSGRFGVVSPDARALIFVIDDRGTGRLRTAPFQSDGTLGAAKPVFPGENEPNVSNIALSPNGRLLAYSARQPDGKLDVFLTDFPGVGGRWLVTEGGSQPRFSPDGREIFYVKGAVDANGRPRGLFMVAPVTMEPSIKVGPATQLFDDRSGLKMTGAVALDGRRFLAWAPVAAAPGDGTKLVIVQNWIAALRK